MHPNYFGAMNFNVLRNIIVWGGFIKYLRGAEIGVLHGDTSHMLLAEIPELTLFSVDPYLASTDYVDAYNQTDLDRAEHNCRTRLARFGQRSVFMRETSLEAACKVEDESLDFVFIDANHAYEFVRDDLHAWYPKVRQGGLVAGHDYSWEGTKLAVDEFSLNNNLRGFVSPMESDIWYFVKP